VRNFLNPAHDDSDALELTLVPTAPPATPAAGKYPKPPLWHIYYQPPNHPQRHSSTATLVELSSVR
jgi:hypothetical protein